MPKSTILFEKITNAEKNLIFIIWLILLKQAGKIFEDVKQQLIRSFFLVT